MLKKDRELLKQIAGNMEASQSEIKTLVETLVALSEKSENEKNEATQVNTEQVVEALKILAEKSENNGLKDYSETSQLNNEKIVSMLNKLIEATENNGIKELTQASQEGIKSLTEAMEKQTTRMLPQTIKGNEFTDNEKLIAAYALNLCTVSISQIIDYNDIYILEQEYEAILNNLNLEFMPKDEALLNILKQILDTVTFFRIQEGEKVLQEKKYQHQIKNAIWSSVPNLGVVLASGDPKAMAFSLITQVGAGYMNYRKRKAEIQLEHEEEKWKLQRSAIEQFNGLRRELFDTAWRLADEYKFEDKYRLTERQISQYNAIIMDSNPIRRYERLETIKGNFEAYLPFWYYLGKAAYDVYSDKNTIPEIKEDFKKKAKDGFEYYFKLEEKGCKLLRENQITAACALEYVSFLSCVGIETNKHEKLKYIERAIHASGGANDILNICATEYLKLGETEKASALFKHLINEDYNTSINIYILSNIYVSGYLKTTDREYYTKYKLLQTKLKDTSDENNLMPWIESTNKSEEAQRNYLQTQKYIYARKYVDVLMQIFAKYENNFALISKKVGEATENTEIIFEEYGKEFINLFNVIVRIVHQIPMTWSYEDTVLKNTIKLFNKDNIKNNTGKDMQKEYSYVFAIGNFFEQLTKNMLNRVKRIKTMSELVEAESKLFDFCNGYGYVFPTIDLIEKNNKEIKADEWFVHDGESTRDEARKQTTEMKNIVKQFTNDIEKAGNFNVITEDIEQHLTKLKAKKRTIFSNISDIRTRTSDIIAIIDKNADKKDNLDLLLTLQGVHIIKDGEYYVNRCEKYSNEISWLKAYKNDLGYEYIERMIEALNNNLKKSQAEKRIDQINLVDIVNSSFEKNKEDFETFRQREIIRYLLKYDD